MLYAIFDTGQKISVLRLRAGGKNFMKGCLRWFLCDFIEDLGALRTLTLFRIVLWSQKRTTYIENLLWVMTLGETYILPLQV